MNLLSLTKIGNIKIGRVKNGKPIATERILVTEATKENEENFKIMRGFNLEGEESINVTLPFDNIDLNFEVNYVGFATINDIEYIAKAKDFGDEVLLYPLNVEDFDKKAISMGELTDKLKEHLAMERTGFLKVQINGVSGFGEVFYFKTKSINSIRAITDQLRILSAMTGGYLADLPLVIKPIKKDINEKQIIYLSIAFAGSINNSGSLLDLTPSLNTYIEKRKESNVSIEALEQLYVESRTLKEDEIIPFEEIENAKLEVDKDTEKEIHEVETEAEKKETEVDLYVKNFFKENGFSKIPVGTGVALLKLLKEKEAFENYFSEERTLPEVIQYTSTLLKREGAN